MSSGKVLLLSEYSIVSENRLTTVPEDTPEDLCAILGCALTTAMGIIDNEVDLKFGESVAVVGCGGVGLNLLQAAAMKSACPIYAIEKNLIKRSCFTAGATTFY
jgi:S-(hydroxymethyl)glutathione dehydrogenase/alcohol dehydrogenase